jgi:hypothetical protein
MTSCEGSSTSYLDSNILLIKDVIGLHPMGAELNPYLGAKLTL